MIRTLTGTRVAFLIGLALVTTAGSALLVPQEARADDCLLDTNNDGNADTNVDTDLGADSGGSDFSLACGPNTQAGLFSTAIGPEADAVENFGTALGWSARALAEEAIAVGAFARAVDLGSVAIGSAANAAITPFVAFPSNDPGIGQIAPVALGSSSQAFGGDSMAIGSLAIVGVRGVDALTTTFVGSTAVGAASAITADNGTSLGARTSVSADGATALGAGSTATAANSVAIGANSVADQANTVSVGAAGAERRIVNVAAGVAPTDAVNVSQLGAVTGNVTALQTNVTTLQTNVTTLQTNVTTLQTTVGAQATQITALQAADAALGTRVTALEAVALDFNEDLDRVDDRASAGTAAAVALSGGMFLPGKSFNLTGNLGAYRGAVAGALQLGALISDNAAVNAGIAHGFNKGGKTALRAGFTFGW